MAQLREASDLSFPSQDNSINLKVEKSKSSQTTKNGWKDRGTAAYKTKIGLNCLSILIICLFKFYNRKMMKKEDFCDKKLYNYHVIFLPVLTLVPEANYDFMKAWVLISKCAKFGSGTRVRTLCGTILYLNLIKLDKSRFLYVNPSCMIFFIF